MTTSHARIGVIGSGAAGLTAAYVASRTAHVTLFEADERLGGHADTHVVHSPEGELRIDTGFIVHNRRTYPTLLRLFAELGIATQPSRDVAVRTRPGLGRTMMQRSGYQEYAAHTPMLIPRRPQRD